MNAPIRNPHGSRSGPLNHENPGGPDLSFNSPNPSTLCNLTPRKASGHREPNWPVTAVVTWTALATPPANGFRGRRSRGAERRKAMETQALARHGQWTQSLGSRGAERRKAMETLWPGSNPILHRI